MLVDWVPFYLLTYTITLYRKTVPRRFQLMRSPYILGTESLSAPYDFIPQRQRQLEELMDDTFGWIVQLMDFGDVFFTNKLELVILPPFCRFGSLPLNLYSLFLMLHID